jgi:hypothetical protein
MNFINIRKIFSLKIKQDQIVKKNKYLQREKPSVMFILEKKRIISYRNLVITNLKLKVISLHFHFKFQFTF